MVKKIGIGETMNKKANFGKVKIHNETASYRSRNWEEVSESVDVVMYTTVPRTMEAVEYPSITLDLGGHLVWDICPHCNLPMDEHELSDEFIEKIQRREKNKPIRIDDIHSLLVNQ